MRWRGVGGNPVPLPLSDVVLRNRGEVCVVLGVSGAVSDLRHRGNPHNAFDCQVGLIAKN